MNTPPVAGDYSIRIHVIQAAALVPIDEDGTPDPVLRVEMQGLPCGDQVEDDKRENKQADTFDPYFNCNFGA